jgi:hypothetical protein
MLFGLVLLAVGLLILVAGVVDSVADGFVVGVVWGLGGAAIAWGYVKISRQLRPPPRQHIPGRSNTRDCRQARWSPPNRPMGAPHPPTAAQRRVRPCPNDRHR